MKFMSRLICNSEPLEDVDLVIFDKDGTLIDIHYYWCSMIRFRAQHLSTKFVKDQDQENAFQMLVDTMGIDSKLNKMKPEGPVGLKPRNYIIDVTYQCMQKYSKSIVREDVVEAFKYIDLFSKGKLSEIVRPLPGVELLLKALKANEIKVAIATTDLTERAQLAMKSIGFEKYFDLIVGADRVQNAKPSPDLVHYTCEKLKINLKQSVVVGDSMADLKMAENAKCRFIGVKTGLYTPNFLEQSLCLVDDLNDVRSL